MPSKYFCILIQSGRTLKEQQFYNLRVSMSQISRVGRTTYKRGKNPKIFTSKITTYPSGLPDGWGLLIDTDRPATLRIPVVRAKLLSIALTEIWSKSKM